MKRSLFLMGCFCTAVLSGPSWALEAHFSNDTGMPITISVQDNNCVTYLIEEQTYTLPGKTPPSGWTMNLGDRNTGGCSTSYMLAWGIYAGTEVDPANKIGDINFHFQSSWSLKTWQNLTANTEKFFPDGTLHICSDDSKTMRSWDDAYVWWQFGYKRHGWNCDAPVN